MCDEAQVQRPPWEMPPHPRDERGLLPCRTTPPFTELRTYALLPLPWSAGPQAHQPFRSQGQFRFKRGQVDCMLLEQQHRVAIFNPLNSTPESQSSQESKPSLHSLEDYTGFGATVIPVDGCHWDSQRSHGAETLPSLLFCVGGPYTLTDKSIPKEPGNIPASGATAPWVSPLGASPSGI